ncbi:SDR family NAD(P)-dependent oxidoreductase [Kitasatospora aureofaciens]|uniref:type I polyketide synthase n=1 Tax=Kitasatospora aureofaciens TaxID=1894 RepID=UPI001C47C71E|nr:type I polyketide synthase [Kitasatospora aureofaciens]MBV6699788.1 SDR family NAD(P)-dependent oxidoreductase [Kitasatospora aureofaciens]
MNEHQPAPVEPNDPAFDGRVAIVGMAGRFPGADSADSLWELLTAGTETVRRFGPEELRADGVPDAEAAQPGYVPAKGVLDDIAGFDSQLFGYSALEASVIDPQQRIFLECAWEALEDAGCDPERATGPVGVYAGSMLSTYLIHNLVPRTDLAASVGMPMVFHGNTPDGLATRVAYKFDLRGPAVSVQTACSTSLVSVHLAAQALLAQECDLALAGGVTVTVPNRSGYLPVPGGIESADGHCRPFGAEANGTVFSNGAGVVVLKRLADALADGDRIHAVILGSAVNNDGAAKVGYTAPGFTGQREVIREALSVADVDPRSIGYVEAHGTGTAVGDPIEVAALTAAYREAGTDSETGWCALGSVKSNLGHLDAAAGVTGLIKTVQVLRHGRIPATLHAAPANPELGLADSPFYLPDGLRDWPAADGPRRAAVSAFGIGGTNAHVVLEQAPVAAGRAVTEAPALPVALPLSAQTATALDRVAERLADDLAAHPDRPLADVARTLRDGRRRLPHRRVVVADTTASAVEALRAGGRHATVQARSEQGDTPVAFLLPGQGAQYPRMALGLYEAHPVFRAALDETAALLRPHLGRDLIEVLRAADEAELRRSSLTQPAVLAVSYALAKQWEHWGVRPTALLGHSLGELTAALLAGVFDLADALALVAARGRLMEETEPGAMLAVPLAEADAAGLAAAHGLSVAAVNGPSAAVLSGRAEAVEAAEAELRERGLHPLWLPVDRAFHSELCRPAAEAFETELAKVTLHAPQIPFLSNLTGDWITAEQSTDPAYWAAQMLAPVRFHEGVQRLRAVGRPPVLAEAGPGSVLTDLVRAALGKDTATVVARPSLPTRGRRTEQDDARHAVLALGDLWAHGAAVRWEPLADARPADLPGYPFERRPHWIEPYPAGRPAGPVAAARTVDAVHGRVTWQPVEGTADTDPLAERRHTWLVFVDRENRAQPVVDLLTARGQIVTVVRPGPDYRRLRRGVYQLDPADQAQYNRLFADLRALVRTPTAALYGWGLDAADGQEGEDYLRLVRVARAMTAERVVNEVRLGVLTAGAFRTADGEPVEPAAALLSGLVQVLPEEYPNLVCTQVDLAQGADSGEFAEDAVRALLTAPARLLALRGKSLGGNGLFTRVVEPVERPVPAASARLRHGGTYVITGGLGGIGLVLARHLARACAARLVLIGRSAAPADGPGAEALAGLAAAGAEVLTLQADVTDHAALERALDEARERFGRIDGVVHAAGLAGGGSIELRSDEEMRAVLAPKTVGTRNLLAALRPGEADVLVLCSSLAALVPTYGQADYTAANAYLAGVAEAETARGGRYVVAVDWDTWAEVGMADRAELPADLAGVQDAMLAGAITPAQGARAFAAVLAGPAGRAVVARAGAAGDRTSVG